MRQGRDKSRGSVVFHLLFFAGWFLLVFLQRSFLWAQDTFGNIGMDEIIYTLRMPLEGVNTDFLQDFSETVLLPAALAAWAAVALWRIFRLRGGCRAGIFSRKAARIALRLGCAALFCLCLAHLASAADSEYGLAEYFAAEKKERTEESGFLKEQFVDPNSVEIRFPEKKRNLIYLLMESAETSNQDRASGGLFEENYIPELTRLARENVSFSRSPDRIEGARVARGCSWTIAGMVAQSSGLPLVVRSGSGNHMDQFQYFLPGVTNLGDILEREGYHNCFLLGSEAEFAGRDLFMHQHGNCEIWDYNSAVAEGKIPEDYFVWWGYEDAKLFAFAREKLTQLAAADEPFAFTLLTADTHHIGGYYCERCTPVFDRRYANVWACASRQVSEFVEWVRSQPFYEDTTVVLCGDHLSMDPEFYRDVPAEGRFVYNAVIHSAVSPVKETGRDFTTLDMFPTTLAAMGAEIEGDRLGLGTNLFSDRQTLCEEFGIDELNEGIVSNRSYYNEKFLYK